MIWDRMILKEKNEVKRKINDSVKNDSVKERKLVIMKNDGNEKNSSVSSKVTRK
jgi:hypothetical protein